METCKYSLRDMIETLENHIKFIEKYFPRLGMDFPKKTLICNSLRLRVERLKDYLSIPYSKPKRESFNQIFKNGMKGIKK